jgi:hypothetical protein
MQARQAAENSVRKSTIKELSQPGLRIRVESTQSVAKHARHTSGGKTQTTKDSSVLTSPASNRHTTRRASPMAVRSMALLVLISVLFFVLLTQITGTPASNDLRALWLAGQFFQDGALGDVYAGSVGVFSMTPAEAWIGALKSEGVSAPVYPFVYPPLWAWILSNVTAFTTFDEFARILSVLNPCLIILSALLAMRIAQPQMSRLVFLIIGLGIAATSLVFLLPLSENQPHILVAFLTLLGIERARFGSPVVAGLAMALAASLKLYPALFALFWLVAGERRPTLFFALFGCALGLGSIGVAGWPMHAAFLNEVAAISNTVLMLRSNLSLESMIGLATLAPETLSFADTSATGGATSWRYIEKPQTWQFWSMALQAVAFASLLLLAWRTKLESPLFWPLAFLLVAWLSPISWMYYFIPAFLFLPALFDRLGLTTAAVLTILITAPTSLLLFNSGLAGSLSTLAFVAANGGAILLAIATFLYLTLQGDQH